MTLIEAIAIVESAKNPTAVRFEPRIYFTYPAWAASQEGTIMKANGCDKNTARMIACTSWGEYQMLGVNIYSVGFTGAIMMYPADRQASDAARFIGGLGWQAEADMANLSDADLQAFAARWNGPGNPVAYAAALRKAAS